MPNATFSGHSGYRLEVSATRSGKSITITAGVRRTGTLLAWWTGTQPWSITLNGTKSNYTWNYDFRNSTWKSLGSRSHTFTTIGSKSYSVTVAMGNGIGTATVSGSVTIPPDAPAQPTNLTVTRSSDTRQNLSFRGNASTNAPYTLTQVQRQWRSSRTSWGDWLNVLNRTGTKTAPETVSWADTGTAANQLYRYRVVGFNSTGHAISTWSGYVFTTPAAPTKITAESISSTQVKVTVEESTLHTEFNTLLEYRIGTGSWQTLTTLGKNVSEHTFTPPTGASVTVRGRLRIADPGKVGDGLTGGYRESNVVPLQAPPLKPTSLSPNGTVLDVAKISSLSWVYTSADTSGQTAYQISIRKDGASSWTEMAKVNSSDKAASFSAGYFDVDGYEWRVRTWGVHANPSPYSDPANVEFAAAPVTAVLSPLGVATTSRATLEWTPVVGQALWRATLYHDGAPVETRSDSGGASSVTFNTTLVNGDSYSVTIEVADGTGLWSEPAEGDFEAIFPSPAPPDFEVSWDPSQGSALIDIDNSQPTPGTWADAAHNSVYRSYDEEEWTLVADELPLDTSVLDPEPVLNREVFYQVRAVSELGTMGSSETLSIFTAADRGFWSSGDSFSVLQTLRMDLGGPPGLDLDTGLAFKNLHYFAGRTSPLEFAGDATSRTGTVHFMVGSVAERDVVEQLATMQAPHLFRLPDGVAMYASVGVANIVRQDDGFYTVSIPVQEVQR